uniref:Uncharacterized protein n=1 Tax=Caenorhabditis japonica TaxID=281687 RepID=A0A8R1IXA0_CAEJA
MSTSIASSTARILSKVLGRSRQFSTACAPAVASEDGAQVVPPVTQLSENQTFFVET